MKKWFSLVGLAAVSLLMAGCSSGQQLLSITISPASAVFGGPGAGQGIQLTALGTYTHPPATKDLTSQVTWKSVIPTVANVSGTGLLTAGDNCGVTGITASLVTNQPTGNIVIGTMTATVDGPSSENCPTTPI
jgi:hypothetical protein